MKDLPDTEDSLVLRTDFSDDDAWTGICREIQAPYGEDEFRAYVTCVSDPAFEGLSISELTALFLRSSHSFMFVVDRRALTDAEHPILVMAPDEEQSKLKPTFRVIPSKMWAVQNNLDLANMDYEDYANNADADGVFRGFPGE
jgi:hypothetical protein